MDIEFIVRLANADSYVIDAVVRRGMLTFEELHRLEKLLRLRPHTQRLQCSVEAAIARAERPKKGA